VADECCRGKALGSSLRRRPSADRRGLQNLRRKLSCGHHDERSRADFIVRLDHEGGKGLLRRDDKVAMFTKDGDMVFSHSTRSLGNSVKDACQAIAGRK
jgi:hypothetical protein